MSLYIGKQDIIKLLRVCRRQKLSAEDIYAKLSDYIYFAVVKEKKTLRILRVGTFRRVKVRARNIRNVQTGQLIRTKGNWKIYYRMSPVLSDKMNRKNGAQADCTPES